MLTAFSAQRYKDYNKIRSTVSKSQKSIASSPTQKKRPLSASEEGSDPAHTPSKRQKPLPSSHPSVIDPYDPPISLLLSPSQQRPYIGPTPQKDGQVLGMFDGLSGTSRSNTPSKRKALENRASNVQGTPSKKSISREASAIKCAATLDVKLTPSIQRITKSCTPGSRSGVRKLRFDDTPAFLRRDSQREFASKEDEVVTGEDKSWSPVAVRKFPQLAGRSLSSIVKELRDIEDERLDEELELMREMEGGIPSPAACKPVMKPRILVEDSQLREMPLGPDGGLKSADDDVDRADGGKERDGKPLKVWKKKGQKRTTRRVNMRPNMAKWKPEQKWGGDDSEYDTEAERDGRGQSSSGRGNTAPDKGNNACEDSDSTDSNVEAVELKRSSKPKEKKSSKEGLLNKARRKISATAHANFRALKIRNKNTKGKRGGRFGKRR